MSWVILEGPDGTGKTTIAEELRKSGYFYMHAGPDDTLPILADKMAKLQGLKHVVWDRCHLGEAVYGPVDRGSVPPRGWWNLIEAFLLEKKATCILLTEQHEDKIDYLGKSGKERFEEVLAAYHRILPTSHLTWQAASYVFPRTDQVDNRDALQPWEWRTDPEGLGGVFVHEDNHPAFPRWWVLGEQQNSLASVPWPFATRCGVELVWPVINPRTTRVSNALRIGQSIQPGDLHDRWEQLGMPQVITLGKVAHKACLLGDVDVHLSLPHPQYHLRFRASESQLYRVLLEGALA